MMRTTVQMKIVSADLDLINLELTKLVAEINRSVPGFKIVVEPHFASQSVLSATVMVTGAGYFLPPYAGNLDIINAAAIETARLHHRTNGLLNE